MTDSSKGLKSAFDLAMERLASKGEGLVHLSEEQKAALASISAKAKASIAEMEIMYGKKLEEARKAGDGEKMAKLEEAMRSEISRIKDREASDRKKIR